MFEMTTRSKKKSLNTDTKETVSRKRIENSWILLVKKSLLDNDNFDIITLPHPAHGEPRKYCLDNINRKIYEVVTFSEPYRSWFLNDTVKSDGSFMLVTPINPIYLVLPRLREQCITRAVPMEDLLSEKSYDKILNFITNLDAIADLKGQLDIRAYKYNEEKTLNWLENKIRKLAAVLRDKNIQVTSGAVSATFVSSNVKNENIDEELYLKYAHGIISEYLEDEIVELLEKKLNFKAELIEYVGNKRKSETDIHDTVKRLKVETNGESEDMIKFSLNKSTTAVPKQKLLTAKEKARQKAANGTKTISTFFCKK